MSITHSMMVASDLSDGVIFQLFLSEDESGFFRRLSPAGSALPRKDLEP